MLTNESRQVHCADSIGAYETVRPVEQNVVSDVKKIIPEGNGTAEET